MTHPIRRRAAAKRSQLLVWLFLLALAPPSTLAERDVNDLVVWARPKVVLVYVQPGGPPRWGTGFVAERGRVITNHHVIRDARAITVWANGTPYPARVAVVDRSRDLAVLVIPTAALELKPLLLAADGRGRPGEPVLILASRVQRGAGQPAVQVWPVSGSAWEYTWLRWPNGQDQDLRLLARAELGDSGSPVLRLRDGAVVGIIRGRTNPDGLGRSDTAWAVPVEALYPLLARVPAPAEPATRDRYYLETLAHPDQG